MPTSTIYLTPNITIETETIGAKKFFVYNFQGVHYRVFRSLAKLEKFIVTGKQTWVYDCLTEKELEKYLKVVTCG